MLNDRALMAAGGATMHGEGRRRSKRFLLPNWQYLTISHKREEVVWDRDQFNNRFASERRAAPCCDAANWLGLFRQIAWLPCDGLAGPPHGG
jgi:hypothetical protein